MLLEEANSLPSLKPVSGSGLEQLRAKIEAYYPQADFNLIYRAYEFARRAHGGQFRRSGEEFITHPLEVALILAELQLDVTTIAAGLLHDVVEDTGVTVKDLEAHFNREIADLVDGVTKLGRIEYRSKEEQQVENWRKMFLAMAKDVRVVLIKLADRLHNMRTLRHQPEEKQREIAEETLEIFAPLAHRLGIFRVKWELEDLSLRFLEPDKYYSLVQSISAKRKEREELIEEVCEVLRQRLAEAQISADIQGRPKHFYSIYHKMVKQGKELSEIYDLIAIRIIVNTVRDCYAALGIIHALWKPIPGRFKDYIAMPKPNMYQSLHTTVIGPRGDPIEVQIRTWEMHKTAEYGIAAHWKYKEGGTGDKEFEEKLSWLRQLLDWQREAKDAREFMEALKIDLFSDRVYVFTPKGDVVELPAGSVPIDFAYKVHTAVGHQCVGAKVNGRIVPLDYRLKTGDIVEILTQKGSGPSRDWLNLVATSQAKSRIRQWFKREQREESIARGKELLEKELKKQGIDSGEVVKSGALLEAGKKFNLMTLPDIYAALGEGVLGVSQVMSKIRPEAVRQEEPLPLPVKPPVSERRSPQGVWVKGESNVAVRLAKCCNPLPGDDIIGYVTRGRGVSIHRADCSNILHYYMTEEGRIIEVSWDESAETIYHVHLEVLAHDRPRLAMDIISAVADAKTIINAVHARATKDNFAVVDLKVEIRNLDHLNYIMDKVRRIKDVLEVRRVTPGPVAHGR